LDATYTKTIDDPIAPERLKGKILTVRIEEGKSMTFEVEIPDEPNGAGEGLLGVVHR